MRKFKKAFSILFAFILSVSALTFSGCGGDKYTVKDLVIPVYEDNYEMLMFADHGFKPTVKALTTYKEAGLNTYNFYPGYGSPVDAAKVCEEVGINMLIFGGSPLAWGINESVYPDAYGLFPNYFKQFDDAGIDFHDYPAVKGFYFIDEPGADLYDDIAEHYASFYNEKYSDLIWHINLFPSYATPAQLNITPESGTAVYEKYIDRFVDEVLTNVDGNNKDVGVDHYPLRKRGAVNYVSDTYLSDLMVVASAAKRAGVDFSSCIQSAGWGGYRFPSKSADIRFQVYTNLAFGARRLEFYAYDGSSWGNMNAMYMYGKKTEAYYAVQEVTGEIAAFDHVYGAFSWEGVKTFKGDVTEMNNGFKYVTDKELTSLDGLEIKTVPYDLLVGQFMDADQNKGFMLVNYTEPTLNQVSEIECEFEDAKGVIIYRSGIQTILPTEKGEITIPLEAGEGVFVIPLYDFI